MTSTPSTSAPIVIDVWSDIMCPFCWLGDRMLERALDGFEHRESVQVRYHSYQLMPDLPADEPVDLTELLSSTKGMSREQVESLNGGIAERGATVGLDYRFDRALGVNTRRAHRLLQLSATSGLQHEMAQRLFRAYFSEGANVADRDVLADLAADVGLDRGEVLSTIDGDELDAAVDADIRGAQQVGVQGVPFFVFDGKYAVSGAQPEELFGRALETVWNERTGAGAPPAS